MMVAEGHSERSETKPLFQPNGWVGNVFPPVILHAPGGH
jgi:hypothetical protein